MSWIIKAHKSSDNTGDFFLSRSGRVSDKIGEAEIFDTREIAETLVNTLNSTSRLLKYQVVKVEN